MTYSHINLPTELAGNGVDVDIIYDATGRKWRKSASVNGVVETRTYANGVEFVSTSANPAPTLEAINHSGDGRTVFEYDGGTLKSERAEYYHADHLGNVRLAFSDLNLDGVIIPEDLPQTPQDDTEVTLEKHYYPFGLEHVGPWYGAVVPESNYQYNGKELDEATGLYDYGARYYDPAIARWTSIDPLASDYAAWSPYNYVMGNPIRLIDPDGQSVFGDIYNLNGVHVGNDGKEDNQVYVLKTTHDAQLTEEQALLVTNGASAGGSLNPLPSVNLTSTEGITHEQFQQFAANVYNEVKDQSYVEKTNVASAIVNRKNTHSLGGSWQNTLDKIMSSKDSHQNKMSPGRVDPAAGEVLAGTTSVQLTDIRSGNYQNFYNATPTQRNNDLKMRDSVRATIRGLIGPDRVSGSNEWRGRGSYNAFGKERQKTSTFKRYN